MSEDLAVGERGREHDRITAAQDLDDVGLVELVCRRLSCGLLPITRGGYLAGFRVVGGEDCCFRARDAAFRRAADRVAHPWRAVDVTGLGRGADRGAHARGEGGVSGSGVLGS